VEFSLIYSQFRIFLSVPIYFFVCDDFCFASSHSRDVLSDKSSGKDIVKKTLNHLCLGYFRQKNYQAASQYSLQCLEKVRGSLRDCCRSCSGEGAWEFERLLSFL
jgi:hypothetical protein